MIQARDPSLVGRPFFARFDPDAVWLSDLVPAFADQFPFEPEGTPATLAADSLWSLQLIGPAG